MTSQLKWSTSRIVAYSLYAPPRSVVVLNCHPSSGTLTTLLFLDPISTLCVISHITPHSSPLTPPSPLTPLYPSLFTLTLHCHPSPSPLLSTLTLIHHTHPSLLTLIHHTHPSLFTLISHSHPSIFTLTLHPRASLSPFALTPHTNSSHSPLTLTPHSSLSPLAFHPHPSQSCW